MTVTFNPAPEGRRRESANVVGDSHFVANTLSIGTHEHDLVTVHPHHFHQLHGVGVEWNVERLRDVRLDALHLLRADAEQ